MLHHRRRSWLCRSTEGSAIHKTGLNEQNHLPYQKLHLRKRLVVLVLLKASKLVSKFENSTPGADSPFSKQRKRFLDNLGRSSTWSSLLAVEFTTMVLNAFQINSCVFSKECECKKIRSLEERSTHCHLRSANTASIACHWPPSGDVWVQACSVGLLQCPSYSINAVVHTGKQRLSKPRDCHQIITSSRTRLRLAVLFCLPCKKYECWGRHELAPVNVLKEPFADQEACGDRYRIEHAGWWLDQQVAILADQPLCSDELDKQLSSLLCQYNLLQAVVSAAACNSPGCLDRARLAAHVTIDEHAPLSAPSPAVAVFTI